MSLPHSLNQAVLAQAAQWKQWKARLTERGIALDDAVAMLRPSVDLARLQSVPMAVIWAIRGWIEQGLV